MGMSEQTTLHEKYNASTSGKQNPSVEEEDMKRSQF
jgi:hypothetical protein